MQEMRVMQRRRGSDLPLTPETRLDEIGWRSLDLSELALRVEDKAGTELNFDGVQIRRIETVNDVLDLLEASLGRT
jgi:acyl carrier protein